MELERRGYDGWAANPWYFPTTEDYGGRLAKVGFAVAYIEIIPRPTPLPGDMSGFLETFGVANSTFAETPPLSRFRLGKDGRLYQMTSSASGMKIVRFDLGGPR